MNGEIVWYRPTKHYGFVTPVDGGGDVFFELSPDQAAGLGRIEPGMAVQFTLAEGPGGAQATGLERGFAPDPL
jgi:CspA family cold shock protein